MWDLAGPGLKPMSPALAGRFLTTVPPGKPWGDGFLKMHMELFLLVSKFVDEKNVSILP